MVTIVMISHLIVFTYNNTLTCKVYYKTLMLMYYNVSCFFLYFSFSSHTVDDPNINTAAVFQAMSQQAQKLFGFMKDWASCLIKNIKDTPNRVIIRVQK